jgi:hypothetical protein
MDKIMAWIKANKVITAVIALVALVAIPKTRKLIFGAPKRRRRRPVKIKSVSRGGKTKTVTRNIAMPSGKGYAAAGGGIIPFKYNKDGSVKKAWQVGGTVAARQRMARLRRNK